MEIPVVIECLAKNGFRAKTGQPLALSAQGSTRQQALKNLQRLLQRKLRRGLELASLLVPAEAHDNPWISFAGMFKDEPMFDEVLKIMAESRRKDNADPHIP